MSGFSTINNEFLKKVVGKIEENLSDEHFGVSELAREVNMSRSNLLRKVKNIASLSVSQLIRKIRLQKARELLTDDTMTVSEVSFKVGFNSTSYFIKCFKEEYGHSPGELGKIQEGTTPESTISHQRSGSPILWSIALAVAIVSLVLAFFWLKPKASPKNLEKSIAVLPFKNDSNDSSNVYLINGLMEAILSHLQKIEDVRVVSRTSVEKYRDNPKTIREISEELGVNYCVEGSGQKIGEQILLTVQLIEAPADKHVWSQRYNQKVEDIFQLQTNVAKNIAKQIQVIITPDEEKRIDKIPTENLEAYDYYLKGLEYTRYETREGLYQAIENFEEALSHDPEFAHAYAYMAICYYYLDIFQTSKRYAEAINTNADKALLIDADLPESMVAKALFYMQDEQYELAVEYLEKVLLYSPNAGWVSNFLTDIYTTYLPNTEKYLEHALRANRLNMGGQDSVTASYTYLHLSNALVQTGFLREAEGNIRKSLAYNPSNLYAEYLFAYIRLAQNRDLKHTKQLLLDALKKDTTRLDIMQEVAKVCYYMRDFEESMKYYDDFIAGKKAEDLNIYRGENAIIGYVMEQVGRLDEAKAYFADYKDYADNNQSIYQNLSLSVYHAHHNNVDLSLKYLKAFTEQENYQFWVILFLKDDPLIENIKHLPEFDKLVKVLDEQFWSQHEKIREILEAEELI